MHTTSNNERIAHLFDLKGKVAIVTGASKGIGESIARGLAEFGANVVVSSRNQEAVDGVAESFRKEGLEAFGVACHVGEKGQLQRLVQVALDIYGGIDILVNNAATNPVFGPISEADEKLFDKIMEINLKAPFLLSNLVFPHMRERGGGSIIHISSVEGLKPSPGLGIYSVSKAALAMLTQSQAKEWGAAGIRVNAICPGLIKTKFSAAIWQNEAILKNIVRNLPSGRIALPDEMAGLAVFLASPAASYCTGGIYSNDGGFMII